MRAITQTAFGGPGELRLTQLPRPQPLPTEVLVRVHATSVNPVECFIRSGAFPMLGKPPFVLGWDVSGVVAEVVPGTNRFKTGDEVFGMPLFPRPANAYAEYVQAPSRQLALKPRALSHTQAAALSLVGLTAWQALVDIAKLKAGQRVLIHGGAGGVGHIAVQIAKSLGAQVITTVSAAKRDLVEELGVDEVIDYKTTDFAERARDIDVVLDVIGGGYAERSFHVLRPTGILVTAVERTNSELVKKAAAAGRQLAGIAVEPDYVALEKLAGLAQSGQLKVHVDRVFPLEDAARAHEFVERGSTKGKVALQVA
jgi:NADPH:quinone reductase-like Zn-dependent oxidoreductase